MKPSKKELFYNDMADNWKNVINNAETKKRIKVIFGILLNGIDVKNKKILEVGCGMGYFSQKLFELGGDVTGIDVGDKLVKITQNKVPQGKFLVASALDLPFKDGVFDIVICTEVIEHTEDPRKAISELMRVVKKNGLVVMTTPNKLFKPLFDLLSVLRFRPYNGNENWLSVNESKLEFEKNNGVILTEHNFNFIYPNTFFDYFEKIFIFRHLMINQGFLVKKK